MLSNLRHDIRYALRTLARNPSFAVAAIAPIALGIGINTGVFSILNSVAWRPLPVPDPQALVSIHQDFRGVSRRTIYGARSLFSLPEYQAYRDHTRTLAGVMAYSREWTVTLGRESPQEINGILATCNYFDVLGVRAAMGTGFTPANCGGPDAPPVVILSHALWTRAFGADPDVLQKSIVLNGRDVTVVGVGAAGFHGVDMAKHEFFAPTSIATLLRPEINLDTNAHASWLTLVGRRRADAPLAHVRADLAMVAQRIDSEQPGRTTTLIVEPATALSLPDARQAILIGGGIVLTAFGFVLLIAAANVANILLARAAARTREIAIRLSVGATRVRLIQQLLTESAVIASAGAASGWLLFSWFFQALVPWLLGTFPGASAMRLDATPDGTVFLFTLGLTALTALACGLAPALQASSGALHGVMKKDTGTGDSRGWLRGALVGGQIALCTILLIPAGLLSRALSAAYTFDPGFNYHDIAMISIDLRHPRYEKGNAAIFQEEWVKRIRAATGTGLIADAGRFPLRPGRTQSSFRVGDDATQHVTEFNTVSPEFFPVLGIPIVRGRVFTRADTNAVLVTEATARRYWPGKDAIGQSVTMGANTHYVVGIVRDVQLSQSEDAVSSYMFLPAAPGAERRVSVLVRPGADLDRFAAAVRAETTRMDPGLVVNVQPLADNVGMLQTLSQIAAGVAGTLSLIALGLASIGVYAVVAFVVSRRRREVGLRMALGANARDVQRLIVRQTLRPVAIGMAIGLAVAAAGAHVLRSVLFGVSPYDPAVFIGAPLLMLTLAAAAAFLPTRQAVRLDPMSVLRSE